MNQLIGATFNYTFYIVGKKHNKTSSGYWYIVYLYWQFHTTSCSGSNHQTEWTYEPTNRRHRGFVHTKNVFFFIQTHLLSYTLCWFVCYIQSARLLLLLLMKLSITTCFVCKNHCKFFLLCSFHELSAKQYFDTLHFTLQLFLPYWVKMQYLQIYNIVDTSIERQMFGQSTTVVKGLKYMLDFVDTV